MLPRWGWGLAFSACRTVWCASFHPFPTPTQDRLSTGAWWGPKHVDRGDAHTFPPEAPQIVVGGLRVIMRVSPPQNLGTLELSPCCAQHPFSCWNPTQNWGAILHDLGFFLSYPLQNFPWGSSILLNCQAEKYSYIQWRLGAGNLGKLVSNKVLLMTKPLLCQQPTKLLH